MVFRAANLIVRAVRIASVVTCVFAACASSATPAYAQAAGGKVTPGAPPAPAANAPQGAQPGTPGVAANATPVEAPTVDMGARRPLCERYVAVLSGREKDPALLDKREVVDFAQTVPDLVTCGAVARDSDDLCQRLNLLSGPALGKPETTSGFVPESPYKACRETWSTFHELRAYPKGHSFLFTDITLQHCKTFKEVKQFCEPLRAALRAGDASKCTAAGDLQFMCRAFLKLDKSLCRVPQEGQFWKNHGAMFADGCVKMIASEAYLAGGLKAATESGPPKERVFAQAALGQTDACATHAQAAMDLCMKGPPPPPAAAGTPAGSSGPTPAPTTGTKPS